VIVMDKSPDAFRTISEVAEELDLPQHVLRFWETRFSSIRPLKRGGGRRYYRPDDVELLKGIRHLLYGQGYTIKGVQRILKEDGLRFVQAIGRGEQSVGAGPRGDPGEGDEDIAGAETWTGVPGEAEPAHSVELASAVGASAAVVGGRPLALGQDDIERLRAALDELLECRQILGALKAE
jgi:DNA-binding transcriptional MerR regulator